MSCDDYCTNFGCNSGPGCPVGGACHHMPGCKDAACPGHPGRLHARRVACGQQVAHVGARRPKWLDGKGTAVPPEAGNFQIVDLGPDDDGQPLTRAEGVALAWTLLAWLACVVCVVALVAMGTGYITERWADLLLAFLEGAA